MRQAVAVEERASTNFGDTNGLIAVLRHPPKRLNLGGRRFRLFNSLDPHQTTISTGESTVQLTALQAVCLNGETAKFGDLDELGPLLDWYEQVRGIDPTPKVSLREGIRNNLASQGAEGHLVFLALAKSQAPYAIVVLAAEQTTCGEALLAIIPCHKIAFA